MLNEYSGLDNVHLLPNVTNRKSSIESRGFSLASSLRQYLKKIGAEKCHLLAHSFTGVDCRAAISLNGLDKHVSTLTTLCSPHHGMTLIDHHQEGPSMHPPIDNMQRVFEVLGITANVA